MINMTSKIKTNIHQVWLGNKMPNAMFLGKIISNLQFLKPEEHLRLDVEPHIMKPLEETLQKLGTKNGRKEVMNELMKEVGRNRVKYYSHVGKLEESDRGATDIPPHRRDMDTERDLQKNMGFFTEAEIRENMLLPKNNQNSEAHQESAYIRKIEKIAKIYNKNKNKVSFVDYKRTVEEFILKMQEQGQYKMAKYLEDVLEEYVHSDNKDHISFAAGSDILRLMALYNDNSNGKNGLYLDADIDIVKPLPKMKDGLNYLHEVEASGETVPNNNCIGLKSNEQNKELLTVALDFIAAKHHYHPDISMDTLDKNHFLFDVKNRLPKYDEVTYGRGMAAKYTGPTPLENAREYVGMIGSGKVDKNPTYATSLKDFKGATPLRSWTLEKTTEILNPPDAKIPNGERVRDLQSIGAKEPSSQIATGERVSITKIIKHSKSTNAESKKSSDGENFKQDNSSRANLPKAGKVTPKEDNKTKPSLYRF